MLQYKTRFDKYMGVKPNPSEYELKLFEKTQKYMKYIAWIPGLKMVAICNSLSMYATKNPSSSGAEHSEVEGSLKNKGSDIDLFIITAPNRLWLVRILVTLVFQILGVRRHGNKIAERFCLSFFITENALDFSSFAIENDVYLYFWIYYLKPIINKDLTYEKFIKANKTLGIDSINLHKDNKIYEIQSFKYLKFLDKCKILDFKNYLLKKIFLPFTLVHKKRLGNPFGLIVSDDILKFHDNDRRMEVREEILK